MEKYNNDVIAFNVAVNNLKTQLIGRGQTVQPSTLLSSLFIGYQACAEEKFQKYVEELYNQYIDDRLPLTPEKLMQLTANRYTIQNEKDDWNVGVSQIVALQAKVDKLQRQLTSKKPGKSDNKSGSDDNKGGKDGKKKSKKGKGKGKDGKRKYPAWKEQSPKDGEPKHKEVNGKQYHWCHKHQLWTEHTVQECKLIQDSDGKWVYPEKKVDTAAANQAAADDDDSSI